MLHIHKYHPVLVFCVLFFYLTGAFQSILLEGIHFFSHLNDVAHGHYEHHNFQSHDNLHDHQVIQIYADLMGADAENSESTTEDFISKIKDFPQFLLTIKPITNGEIAQVSPVFQYLLSYTYFFPPIVSPPPQC